MNRISVILLCITTLAIFYIIKENPKYDAAFQALGYIFLEEKDFAKSASYSSKAIALNPNSEQSYINLAVAFYSQQNLIEAKKVLQKAVKNYPNNQQMQLMLNDL